MSSTLPTPGQRGSGYAVQAHPQRDRIVRDLLSGKWTMTAVAKRYGLLPDSVTNYVKNALSKELSEDREERSLRTAKGIMAKIEQEISKLELLGDALDEYLRDPDDPTKLSGDVVAEDIVVLYKVPDPDSPGDENHPPKTIRRKSRLSELITAHLTGSLMGPFDIQIRRDDARRLYIELHRAIGEELDRLAKILGLVKDVKINISRTESWSFIMQDILIATERFPEAREAIIARFEEKSQEAPSA